MSDGTTKITTTLPNDVVDGLLANWLRKHLTLIAALRHLKVLRMWTGTVIGRFL